MIKWLRKHHVSRKERRILEEKLSLVLLDDELEEDAARATEPWRGDPVNQAMLSFLKPLEIKWNPRTGDATFSFEDGTESVRFFNTGIALISEEGEAVLRCRPLGKRPFVNE